MEIKQKLRLSLGEDCKQLNMWALADLTLVFLLLRTKVGTPAAARLEEPGVTFLEELEACVNPRPSSKVSADG